MSKTKTIKTEHDVSKSIACEKKENLEKDLLFDPCIEAEIQHHMKKAFSSSKFS
jgi:hypothetical protein